MIKITKSEAMELVKLGVPYRENGISHDYSGHKHYWLCEHPRNMALLERIRTEKVVK